MKSLVSIILGVYNPNKYELRKAVESIIDQSYANWELLIYDDGSSNKYIEYIQHIETWDIRISVYRNEKHHSLAYGLNYLLELANGDYIARMDGDDYCNPIRLEKMIQFLERNPTYDWVGSNTYIIDENGSVKGTREYPESPKSEDYLSFSPFVHPAVIFRKTALEEVEGYRVHALTQRGEDYELFMRMHSQGMRGYNIQEPLFYYRERTDQYRRRMIKFQVNEMILRYKGFKKLDLPKRQYTPYIFKPLVVCILPNAVLMHRKNKKILRERYQ